MALNSELSAWLMPATAQDEWLRLSSLLNELDDEDVPCRGCDAGVWWPETIKELRGPSTAFALEACRRCPAESACLDYALAADERYGIWGGLLPAERGGRARAVA